MNDYVKEAERLIDNVATTAFANALGEMPSTKHKEARTALLAHIQRGAVPDMHDRIAEAHDASLDEDHTGCRAILKECMRLLAAAPDHFRDAAGMAPDQFRNAAKMMAVQPSCMTCGDHGMVGGLLPNGGGYEADSCPDCTAPAPAEVPMPEPAAYLSYSGMWDTKPFSERDEYAYFPSEMHTYGAAREAAGYARVLEWAVSRWKDEVENRPLENKNRRPLDDVWRQVVRFAGGDPDALLGPSHDAALRGEVQP